ncbi:MAG: DUF1232 domain-containing protein [Burkholderiales bacterium]|nr:DUF1232 domain-containing protein [Burkholderiales bacterium]
MWQRLKRWAKALRNDVMTLWFAGRHPDTPLAAKLLALGLAAYALSPIDLIPDFIPVLGYLDEIVLLPIGIYFCLKMIPARVLAECRARTEQWFEEKRGKPRSWMGAAVIGAIWVVGMWGVWVLVR